MEKFITGIQQAGIGVNNAEYAKYLYRDLFGMDVLLFDDTAEATLMTQYTGSKVEKRRAILSLNLQGGGGFEIWQFLKRVPSASAIPSKLGDIGIYALKIKSRDVVKDFNGFLNNTTITCSKVYKDPVGSPEFWLTDEENNVFNIVKGSEWFQKTKTICGGVTGAVIGVSDMNKAIDFYSHGLGIDEVVYDVTGTIHGAPGNIQNNIYRRVLLQKVQSTTGAFSKLLGNVQLELVELQNNKSQKIFADRYWGDLGFIHLCFDVTNMDKLKVHLQKAGFHFTVDSGESFNMENAAGRFAYVEDPDGTLIELVETHKITIYKKLGLFLDLRKRKANKPLPKWMLKLLAMSKVK